MTPPGKDAKESTRLYTSHPGVTGEHRHWTGDLLCCCSKAYANKNTLLTIYDIEKEGELEYTHMFFEAEKYKHIPVNFDPHTMHLTFDSLFLNNQANGPIEKPETFPYGYVYRSGMITAKWGEGIVRVHNKEKTLVLDFNENKTYME